MSDNRSSSPFALQQHRDTLYTKHFFKILVAIITLAVISRLVVATRYEINWDEFHFLAYVYEYLRGDLSVVLQTFHVHFFTWLPHTAENETTEIIIARLVMATLQFACAYFIFAIARQFSSRNAALFAVVAYFSVSYITKTGASFRYDPIASFFLMASLYLIITKSESLKSLAVAGACVALALLVTIKSALYFPSITIIALLLFVTFPLSKDRITRGFTLLSVAIITFFVLFSLHKSGLSIEDNPAASALKSLNKTVNTNNLFPRWKVLKISLKLDFVFWLPLLFGLMIVISSLIKSDRFSRKEAIILLALMVPLGSVFFYRNAFPYFYGFMLAPASILCAITWDTLHRQKKTKRYTIISATVLIIMTLNIIIYGFVAPYYKNLDRQKKLLDVVHKAFPEPTPYFDRCSMLASYPQAGFFMSTWSLQSYHQQGIPKIRNTIHRIQPPFFIANTRPLRFLAETPILEGDGYNIFEEDTKALTENYIHHWGEIYVAGKHFSLSNTQAKKSFTIIIEGDYTLEGPAEALIDGIKIMPGESFYLSANKHIISANQSEGTYTLRWGKQLYRPIEPPKATPIFDGF